MPNPLTPDALEAAGEAYSAGHEEALAAATRIKPAWVPGLSSIAGAAVCTCPGVAGVHVQGVVGCDG